MKIGQTNNLLHQSVAVSALSAALQCNLPGSGYLLLSKTLYPFALNMKKPVNELLVAALTMLIVQSTAAAKAAGQRVISFPHVPVGTLVTPKAGFSLLDHKFESVPLGKAQGKVRLPADKDIVLVADYHIVEDPNLLKQVADGAVVGIHINDVEAVDATMEQLSHFKRLRRLAIRQVEVTDAGLKCLKSLTNLEVLIVVRSLVRGTTVFELPLKKLLLLDLSYQELDHSGLQKITRFAGLTELKLSNTLISDDDLKAIGKLSKLERLDLTGNKHVTDRGLQYLKGLKYLTHLDIRRTSVTTQGLRQLKELPLRRIVLPEPAYTQSQLREIGGFLKGCKLIWKPEGKKEDMDLFAPLH